MRSRWRTLIVVAITMLVLDQWTKLLVIKHLTPGMATAHARTLGIPSVPRAVEEKEQLLGSSGLLDQLRYFYADRAVRSPCDGRLVDCRPVRVFSRWWDWRYAENKGAAWSLFSKLGDEVRLPFLVGVAFAAVLFIVAFMRKVSDSQRQIVLALSLITGGALGNLIDRARLGYVIDFVDWYVSPTLHWPTFNVADVAISSGVALIALGLLADLRKKAPGEPAAGDGLPDRALGDADRVR